MLAYMLYIAKQLWLSRYCDYNNYIKTDSGINTKEWYEDEGLVHPIRVFRCLCLLQSD